MPEQVIVTVVVENHWLIGALELRGARILDVLNDCRTDYLEMVDVGMTPPGTDQPVAQLHRSLVPKSKVEFVFSSSGQHESPDKRLNHYRSKECFRAIAIVGGNRVSGNVHMLKPSTDLRHTFVSELTQFVPLTEAQLCDRNGEHFDVPLLFLNKRLMSCFGIAEQPSRVVHCG